MEFTNPILKQLKGEFPGFIVNLNEYRKEKLIGKGGYAEVWLATHIVTGEQVALKQLYQSMTPKQTRSFAREIQTMAFGNHPFFVRFIGFSATSTLTLVSEYMANGSLFRFLRSEHRRSRLTGTHRTLIAMGVAHAMNHLHSLGIIHRDLKSMNILLDQKFLPRLCDFGIARFLDPTQAMTTHIGTPHWMAPEILNGEKYGKEVDVYSFGMLLYELLTNLIPWAGLEPAVVIKQVCTDRSRPKLPSDTPEQIRKLIQLCWSQSPEKRPTFSGIYHIFKTGQVAFPDTDPSEVLKLSRRLKKFELKEKNSPPRFSPPTEKPPVKKQASKIAYANSTVDRNIKITNYYVDSSNDSDDQAKEPKTQTRNKYTAEVVYDQFTETEETNSMIIHQETNDKDINKNANKIIQDDTETSQQINLSVLNNPKNPLFFEEMEKASNKLPQSQSRQFFSILGNYFNSKTVSSSVLKKILDNLLPILSNKSAVSTFIDLDLHLKLPLSTNNDEVFESCMNLLIKFFSEDPFIFQNNFNDQMIVIIKQSPSKAILLLSHFVKATQKLDNCWDLLDLMIKYSNQFLNIHLEDGKGHETSRELISVLFYLCNNNEEYRNYRLQHCLNVFRKGIESDDYLTVALSYNSISQFYSDPITFESSLLVKHLKNEITVKPCLSILMRLKHIPRNKELVLALLKAARKHEIATFVLIRICWRYEGAQMLMTSSKSGETTQFKKSKHKTTASSDDGNFDYDSGDDFDDSKTNYDLKWAGEELPHYRETFKLFLSVFYHIEFRMALLMSESTSNLFNHIFLLKDSQYLNAFSSLLQSISIDELTGNDIDILSKRKVFTNFFNAANELRDENSIKAAIEVVKYLSSVQFEPEFATVFQLITEALVNPSYSKIAPKAVQMFAAASEWQFASKKMKKLNVDKIVREKFLDDQKLARYTKKLLTNIE